MSRPDWIWPPRYYGELCLNPARLPPLLLDDVVALDTLVLALPALHPAVEGRARRIDRARRWQTERRTARQIVRELR